MAYTDVVKREIKRFYKRTLVWTIAFILPFAMCMLICLIFAKGSPTNLPVAVLDEDNSEISRMLVRNLNTLPSCNVSYRVTDLNEGHQLILEGRAYAFLVIPKNFQRDMYRLKQPKLVFYYNNQRILIGGIISKDVSAMVQTMLVGIDAKMRSKRGLPMEEAIKQSNLISIYEHVRSNPYFNYQYFLSFVAFGHMLQIHMILTSLWALGTEFKLGTTKDWLKTANGSIIIAFLGKETPYFIIFVILFLILHLICFGFMGIPYNGKILFGLFATFMFIVSCLSIALVFIGINGNFRYGLSNAAFYVAMGFAFAGVTYPTMAMPLAAKMYSSTLPLSYWIQVMIDQSLRAAPIVYDIRHIVSLFVLMLVGLLFLPRVKKLAKDETRWYQQ
ncbi:ABC transporter permease [bacterium]|nr:ABC transporter permease [bacterium]